MELHNHNNVKISEKQYNIYTKIWGNPAWTFLHCVTFAYPDNPTPEQIQGYKSFFTSLQYVLPCIFCRQSYSKFILEPDTLLDENVLKTSKTLIRWLYNIHNKVNDKLDTKYEITYEEFYEKYESYRTTCHYNADGKCAIPIENKKKAYQNACYKECPVISYDIAKQFVAYALARGMDISQINKINRMKKLRDSHDFKNEDWIERNKLSKTVIENMRNSNIQPLELEGEWKGMPTMEELKLIFMLSSTLTNKEIKAAAVKTLPNYKSKICDITASKKSYHLVN